MSDQKFWERVGIRDSSGFRGLLYNADAGCLIAFMYRKGKHGFTFSDLYVRKSNDATYRPLCDHAEERTCEDPISSRFGPYLYVSVLVPRESDGKYIGYDHVSVQKIDLVANKTVLVSDHESLEVSAPYSRAWVSSLIGEGEAEDQLICSIGFEARNGADARVDYKLCTFHMKTGRSDVISELREVFI